MVKTILILSNNIINRLDNLGWSISRSFWNCYSIPLYKLKGVTLGNKPNFFGFSKVKRARGSIIEIGRNLTLRSSATSNLIGVNRPCIFTTLAYDARLTIGNNCGFSGTIIGCFKEITIGNNVLVGANSTITDGDWHPDDPRSQTAKPIIIGHNVWLGINVTVLKGVTIGDGSLIGAGSVVTKSIPPNVMAAGNPCKVLRDLK